MAESIRREGVLTAITVDRRDDDGYELIAGFREHHDQISRLRRALGEKARL